MGEKIHILGSIFKVIGAFGLDLYIILGEKKKKSVMQLSPENNKFSHNKNLI